MVSAPDGNWATVDEYLVVVPAIANDEPLSVRKQRDEDDGVSALRRVRAIEVVLDRMSILERLPLLVQVCPSERASRVVKRRRGSGPDPVSTGGTSSTIAKGSV